MRKFAYLFIAAALIAGGPGHAADTPRAASVPVRIEWGVKLPMRDGVKLDATVYIPNDVDKKLPLIVTITPYVADRYGDDCAYFAKHDFVCAVVDSRGRGNSDGAFDPFSPQEGIDGYDVVEALAKHPAVDGRVVMWGGSYGGYNQWITAANRPPSLKAISPSASAMPGTDIPFRRNIPYQYILQWLAFTNGKTANVKLFGMEEFWNGVFYKHYADGAAFNQLDKYVGLPAKQFQEWTAHPAMDAYWDARIPSDAQYRALDIPILSITGAYDDDQYGALGYYRAHMATGSPSAKARHDLIIGPWDHSGVRRPEVDVGGLKFGPASVVDVKALHVEWYNMVLRNGTRPAFMKDRVTFYVAGEDKWRHAKDIDNVSTEFMTFHLVPAQAGSTNIKTMGLLAPQAPKISTIDRFTADPKDIRTGAFEITPPKDYLIDISDLKRLDGNGLMYQSEPFTKSVTVAGRPRLDAFISLSTKDADFRVRLYEVLADGSSVLLGDDMIRARYRNSPRTAELAVPEKLYKYSFDQFPWFGRKIEKGSRLRLVLTSLNTINYQKNYNSGGINAAETVKDGQAVTVSLFSSLARQTKLQIPINTN
jgi:uncharacterized protein